MLLEPTRQALPTELDEALRTGRLEEAAAAAASFGYL